MSALAANRRHSDMGYLRIDTSQYGHKIDNVQPQPGLLTPLSAACDSRRSSVASSSWSFVSQALGASSLYSSVPSIRSSQEPSTPPPHGLPMDMSFISSDTSFEDLASSHEFEDVKRSFIGTPGILSSSPAHHAQLDSQESWVMVPEHAQSQAIRLPFFEMDTMMPASGDLQSALGVTPFRPQSTIGGHRVEQDSPCNRPWLTQGYEQQVGYDNLVSVQYTINTGAACDYSEDECPWPTSVQADSCIVPAETELVDMGIHAPLYGAPICNDSDVPPSPCGQFQASIGGRNLFVKQELVQPEIQEEFSPVKSELSASFRSCLSSQSERGVKKDRRPSLRSKRKARSQVTQPYTGTLRGSTFEVHRVKSKYKCKLKNAEGLECKQAFDRVEHLRRHEQTHSGEKPFVCVIPPMRNEKDEEVRCGRPFSRRDNLRDHYKTHLSKAKAGRNGRIGFEKFYQILREKEEPEEAEKTITMLEKWRASGKHLKDEEQLRSRM